LMAELAEGWQRTGTWSRWTKALRSNCVCMQTWRPCGGLAHSPPGRHRRADHADPGGDGRPVVAQAPFAGRGLAGGHGGQWAADQDFERRVRPRAARACGAAQADGFSFPSGHSSASMVAYAMLACWRCAATGLAGARRVLRGRADLHHRLEPRGAACALRGDVLAGWVLGAPGWCAPCSSWTACTSGRAPAALARQ
jgi:undecaprenyl-diphosphatase